MQGLINLSQIRFLYLFPLVLEQNLDESKPSSIVYREEVATTKLLVKMVEHVDNLLQVSFIIAL